ncbi:hypothetical protein NG796_17710 [Laspinema sp. A4]|uniref:hypothetical protein n=1 Tax=Laspinema sp. D2d TaxID=2953686 RepID=UPI0021BB1D16|nr:hypothetical protein [Laspinema sp. D2d]MCT7985112.1 hypothetical protein [Laspinema sp. D2d]
MVDIGCRDRRSPFYRDRDSNATAIAGEFPRKIALYSDKRRSPLIYNRFKPHSALSQREVFSPSPLTTLPPKLQWRPILGRH